MTDRVLAACAVIVAVVAAAEAVRRVVRAVIRGLRKLGRLADDLLGEPAHGDQEARPGLMAQVADIRRTLAVHGHRLDALEELRPNGGSSMKDQVTRIARAAGVEE